MQYDTQRAKKIGEDIVKKYLRSINYILIKKNYKCKAGRMDYIAIEKPKEKIIFISVIIRTELYERYRDDLSKSRQIKIAKNVIDTYITRKGINKEDTRLDRIEVFIYRGRYKLHHIKKIE